MPLPTEPTVNKPSPERIRKIIFGAPGCGKTTLAAGWFPKTNLILDTEGSARFLPGKHFIERIKTYSDFMRVVHELTTTQHHYTTVTIDTIDTLIRKADAEAGQRHGKVAAGLVEYGRGFADRDGVVMRDLGKLLASDLGVILVAHPTDPLEVKDEQGEEGERIFPFIDKRLRQPMMGAFDYVLAVHKRSEPERVLITGGNDRYETKRRVSLPDVLPADARQLHDAVKAGIDQLAKV